VRAVIKGDFVVLPCDLVCELGGEALIQTWMIKEASLGGAIGGDEGFEGVHMALGGEREGRRGGLGVWYDTDEEISVKGEETDFIGITKIQHGAVPPAKDSLLSKTSNLVYAMPTDTLFDIVDSKKSLPIRHALIQKHGNVRMLTGHRDAHLYIFPSWVLDMINANEEMDNLSEDVIGWWAKADWQEGFAEKLGLRAIFHEDSKSGRQNDLLDNDVDIGNLSSTWTTSNSRSEELNSTSFNTSVDGQTTANPNFTGAKEQLPVPPILAYIHNSAPAGPLIRRVDTAPLLLLISLQLAKLDSLDSTSTPSPFAHLAKVAYPAGIAARCTVTRPDCLLAENVTVEEKCAIKECVIGANCQIGAGAKLTKCVLMDGVIVGKGCKITSSILGRRVNVGDDSVLVDVEVEDNLKLEPGSKFFPINIILVYLQQSGPKGENLDTSEHVLTRYLAESKSEKFKSSAGLEATEDEFRDAFEESDEDGTPEQSIDF
jgi:translation initiation factor eIF-2B subunit gamma